MAGHDIIVIGASAGGVEALREIVRGIPPNLAAALFVALHIPPDSQSHLPLILSRSGPLPAGHAIDDAEIERGRIYVAPPDHHLLVGRGRMRLSTGPTENRHRPAIDPLFRSAARAYGPRVVGVVLTGSLDDGTAGLYSVRIRGGVAVVQDPADALFPSMPANALEYVGADYRLPLVEIGPVLVSLASRHVPDASPDPTTDELDEESLASEAVMSEPDDPARKGEPSVYACPDCYGTLWELAEGAHLKFRCRVGHAYSADTLLASQGEATEKALWAALRALEESAALAGRLAEKARDRQSDQVAKRFEARHEEAKSNAALLRELLTSRLLESTTPQV